MKDSYQKIWLFQIKSLPLYHHNNNSINQVISKVMFKNKIEEIFGWLFIITIVLLWPVFCLNGLFHNVRRMFDKDYNKKWSEIAAEINSQLSEQGVDETPS